MMLVAGLGDKPASMDVKKSLLETFGLWKKNSLWHEAGFGK